MWSLGAHLARTAVAISCAHRIGYYDALYVALAKSLKGRWLTADNKAAKKLPKTIVTSLGEF